MKQALSLLIIAPLFFFFGAGVIRAELEVKENSETAWLVTEDGKPVLQYNYKTVPLPEGYFDQLPHGKEYAVPRSDYIHPLFGFDGKPITLDWANDHAHHRGIYWAWPEVGYKGELADLHALQKVFARPNGKIDSSKKDGNVTIIAENIWKWKDEEPIVHETASIIVHSLGEDGRKIDLEFKFKGLVDEVTLARRGTTFYGGLNIRMSPLDGFASGSFLEKAKENVPQAAWVFGTWNDPLTNKKMELSVFENFANPDYPGEFVQYPDIQWFQSTFPKKGQRFALKKDETLTLRFQLWLHEAKYDNAAKKEAWKEFQSKK